MTFVNYSTNFQSKEKMVRGQQRGCVRLTVIQNFLAIGLVFIQGPIEKYSISLETI